MITVEVHCEASVIKSHVDAGSGAHVGCCVAADVGAGAGVGFSVVGFPKGNLVGAKVGGVYASMRQYT